uniref:Ankyrin repeat protein n=1 Tax=Panagrolaimus superbus TaxID=310955 RepID=A0A914XS92_9BILA
MLGAREDILKDLEIEEVFIKSLCDNYTFEEREKSLLNNIYKEKIKDFKEPPTVITDSIFEAEWDALSDDEILQIIEEKWKNFDIIQSFKMKLNKIDIYGETELHRAISSDATDLNHIKFLINECGYDEIIDKSDFAGITPLMKAVNIDRTDIVQYLLEKGAKSDATMRNTNTVY